MYLIYLERLKSQLSHFFYNQEPKIASDVRDEDLVKKNITLLAKTGLSVPSFLTNGVETHGYVRGCLLT